MKSGTSTFEFPFYVTDFQEIQHWWVYITGYKSAFHLCPYQFTLTPNSHTSQTELILKFLKNKKRLVMHSNKTHTHLFFRFAASTWNICLYYLDSTK